VQWQAQYEAFGKTAPSVENVTSNLRFPGQYYDAESGLHYNWNRYYDPDTGRYVTSDPIGLEGGLNTYGYVEGNPLSSIDPVGHQTVPLNPITVWGLRVVGGGLCAIPIPGARVAGVGLIALTLTGDTQCGGNNSCSADNSLEEQCEENLEIDLATCAALGKRDGKAAYKICEGQAYARYARCLQGSDIRPPLPPWGTK